ncbi:LADA_0A03532g1_1 [Lachancea dasiensis]|uniref:Glucosidase II subunit alpha n=1 Tax=Lachancea dasiensis TaxID=1072105 RepID=A0A1G4IN50_9SACH|nr:LADA_0A03532g1_1 [Lachancea dasiensis]
MLGSHLASKLFFILVLASHTLAFTDYLLKSCSQSGFCSRNRHYAREMEMAEKSAYSIDTQSIQMNTLNHTFQANILKKVSCGPQLGDKTIILPLFIDMLEGGKLRFKIDEVRDVAPDDELRVLNPNRYDGASSWAFDKHANVSHTHVDVARSIWPFGRYSLFINSKDSAVAAKIYLKKFRLELFYHGKLVLVVNDRMLLNIEHRRTLEENALHKLPEELAFNDFEDTFTYSKDDSLPFGPESVALDFTLVGIHDVYGIPEHADSLRLKDTRGSDPYRLFNVDVFEYNLQAKTPMYGAIPLMIGTNAEYSAGVFWVNAADTMVDIEYHDQDTKTHWISEAGIIDVMIFLADTPLQITSSYTEVTGRPQLPMISSIGYHQCRWNYNDEKDVLTVDSQMDKAGIPYDVIWLDLEYTNDKKFFTWKPDAFPDPHKMLKKLWKYGRNLVTLIDPHLKVKYAVSEMIESNNASVKNSLGDSYHGHCWPGESIWIDTLGASAREIWGNFVHNFLRKYDNLHIWNDMNEPSIFSGPETTAPKDLVHAGGFEERSVHNLYGLTVHEATYDAMKSSYSAKDRRPFVLTRSFYAGSQRTAAVWTGDNVANWDYLKESIPMCLSNNIAGFPFIGADVAGFSGNPSAELLIRWYQAGIWYPFFRGHAHIDATRREPYLLQEPAKSLVRSAIRLRYSLLPTFYTAFHDSSVNGTPIMNPMFYMHPQVGQAYGIDDQFYLGQTGLLVKPITEQGVSEIDMFFPKGLFYEFSEALTSFSVDEPKILTIDAPLEKQPIFIEGGHIIVKRDRYRRSAKLMENDPFTLVIAPDTVGRASGRLYLDDGETFSYQKGAFLEVHLEFEDCMLKSLVKHQPIGTHNFAGKVDKIVIANPNLRRPRHFAIIRQGTEEWKQELKHTENMGVITIENPLLDFNKEWSLDLSV